MRAQKITSDLKEYITFPHSWEAVMNGISSPILQKETFKSKKGAPYHLNSSICRKPLESCSTRSCHLTPCQLPCQKQICY